MNLTDGIPSLVPSAGHAVWLYWFVDGLISGRVVTIEHAPAGMFRVVLRDLTRSDEGRVLEADLAVPPKELETRVRALVEGQRTEGWFVWLPTEVPA